MNYLVVDLETSVDNVGDNAVGKFKASPFYATNQIVAYGWCSRDDPTIRTTYLSKPTWNLEEIDILVAHNMQFELSYLWRFHKEELEAFFKRGGKVWDTMTVEYLLTNLLHKFPSLNATCVKYGGTLKNDLIKAYWDAGICTEDIPKIELIPYLRDDVRNTKLTYLGQVKRATELGMEALIECHMEAMLALADMNRNGLKFDVRFARKEAYRLTNELTALQEEAVKFMRPYFVPEFEINPGSDQQLSAILFGGPYSYTKRGPILNSDGTLARTKARERVPKLDEDGSPMYYKSGKRKGEQIMVWVPVEGEIKEKNYDYVARCKGLGFIPNPNWQLKNKQFYSVGEDNLKLLVRQSKTADVSKFLTNIIKISTVKKDLSTYFIGYTNLVWPDTGLIHPNFNTSLTATGRLSSSAPNLQNCSAKKGSRIKECFVSRWGEDGTIVEADLSQIEVVVQAYLSQDIQMMLDIVNGIDFHCKRLAFTMKQDYKFVHDKCHVTKDPVYVKKRKDIKTFSFQKALIH